MDPEPATGRYPFQLSVQFALAEPSLPTRQRLRAWAAMALLGPVSAVLRIVDRGEAQALNRDFRQGDYATNVLTFAYGPDEAGRQSGDIALCWPVVCREAQEQGKPLSAHCAHLVVHGMLHLQGLDHVEPAEAASMEALETRILARLGFPDPYLTPDDPGSPPADLPLTPSRLGATPADARLTPTAPGASPPDPPLAVPDRA